MGEPQMNQQQEEETINTASKSTTVQSSEKGFLATLLGPFTTSEFWVQLFAHLAQQALAAFLSALGGVLVYYGKKTFNNSMGVQSDGRTGSDVNNRAFSGSFAPAPTFDNDFSPSRYNVDNTPRGDSRFPGFGR